MGDDARKDGSAAASTTGCRDWTSLISDPGSAGWDRPRIFAAALASAPTSVAALCRAAKGQFRHRLYRSPPRRRRPCLHVGIHRLFSGRRWATVWAWPTHPISRGDFVPFKASPRRNNRPSVRNTDRCFPCTNRLKSSGNSAPQLTNVQIY